MTPIQGEIPGFRPLVIDDWAFTLAKTLGATYGVRASEVYLTLTRLKARGMQDRVSEGLVGRIAEIAQARGVGFVEALEWATDQNEKE